LAVLRGQDRPSYALSFSCLHLALRRPGRQIEMITFGRPQALES
jgi:hypothetical protein